MPVNPTDRWHFLERTREEHEKTNQPNQTQYMFPVAKKKRDTTERLGIGTYQHLLVFSCTWRAGFASPSDTAPRKK